MGGAGMLFTIFRVLGSGFILLCLYFLHVNYDLVPRIWWYDILEHGCGGVMAAIIILDVFQAKWSLLKDLYGAIISVFFGTFLGALGWEYAEYFLWSRHGTFLHYMSVGVSDAISDIVIALICATFVLTLYLVRALAENHSTTN